MYITSVNNSRYKHKQMNKTIKKYSFRIAVIILIIFLIFWYIPGQEKLYLYDDFTKLEIRLQLFMIVVTAILVVLTIFFALRKGGSIVAIVKVLVSAMALGLSFYLFFQSLFLSGFLLVNSIVINERMEQKYLVSFYDAGSEKRPLIMNLVTMEANPFDRVANIDHLKNAKQGDTVIVLFKKGLLGCKFRPEIP